MFTSEKMVKFLREKYPPGTRIRLVSMEDPYAPVAPGTEGTLVCVDDAGQFQMKWDNGRTLALIPGQDSFTVLPPERSMLKLYMPLTAELYEPDEWGDMPEEAERLTGGELASYEDKIRSALFSLDLSMAFAPQLGYALLASGEAERSRLWKKRRTSVRPSRCRCTSGFGRSRSSGARPCPTTSRTYSENILKEEHEL